MQKNDENRGMRLAKYMSNAGIASRRKCEELIAEGRVTVNGESITTPVCIVTPGVDKVCYEGHELRIGELRYIAFNKPAGFTCTRNDPHARRVIYDLLPESMRSLYYVGRLDRDTEGLLLLTNDGDFSQALTHPSFEIEKRYIADCAGEWSEEALRMMLRGVEDEGERLRAKYVKILRQEEGHIMLQVILTEGKKREVRRLCAAVGLEVLRLARVAIGNVELGRLPSTEWRALTKEELDGLRRLVRGR